MSSSYDPDKDYNDTNLSVHPYKIVLFLLLTGITMLFLGLSASYVYTRWENGIAPIKLPGIFLFNTIILLASSYCMHRANKAYLADQTQKYQNALILTFFLSLVFLIAQYFGWQALWQQLNALRLESAELGIKNALPYQYVHIISIVHFGHVILGLPFLAWFIYIAVTKMKEPYTVLIYFSDPEKRLRLRLITFYWHYLDILWVYLVLFFTINYFIK